MKATIVRDEDGLGETLVIRGDVERENPIRHLFSLHVNRYIILGMMHLKAKGLINNNNEEEDARYILGKQAVQNWPATLTENLAEPAPQYLIDLLSAEDKNTQIRLLRGATITPAQLISFVCKAWEKGFTYSKYSAHHSPNGIDQLELPHLFKKEDDGTVKKVGGTSMSDGQLKQVLEHRKVIVATILDKRADWHCFFATYRGLAGKENYKGGQPHMHYISSKWGIVTRQQVLDGISAGTYISNNAPHIDLLDLENTSLNNS
ncbi:hypothetical protein H8B13_08955 [Hymenobacter sp. BT188]|uniref:hypothetical protein n=1 Tax=Hymenobacter sp. BT188 TaxID=2763504 RepID=UPI0016512C01|nr:hypothetical protein [Hymenobacter sp. BT188]MBC6606944.1 hypothetical protein [Hymenobacter sp. BT188]